MSRRPDMARKRNAMATLGGMKRTRRVAPKGSTRVQPVEKAPSKESGAGHQISPLAPKTFANLPPLAGVRLATGQAGIKYRDRPDVLFMVWHPQRKSPGC